MDRSKFSKDSPGKLIKTEDSDFAFVPDPLPPKWKLPDELWPLVVEANRQLAILDRPVSCRGDRDQQHDNCYSNRSIYVHTLRSPPEISLASRLIVIHLRRRKGRASYRGALHNFDFGFA